MNKLELTSVSALVAYVAHAENISESTVAEMVTTHFHVEEVTKLPSRSYDDVIRFLVDAQMNILLN